MPLGKHSKVKVVQGIHKGKKGILKDFVGKQHLTIEFEDGSLDVIPIVYVQKA